MHKSNKQRILRRLRILEGQVRGLQRMVERGDYCIDVITQSLAAKEALSSFENEMLKNHLETHVAEQIKNGQTQKAVKEILSVYKYSKRK